MTDCFEVTHMVQESEILSGTQAESRLTSTVTSVKLLIMTVILVGREQVAKYIHAPVWQKIILAKMVEPVITHPRTAPAAGAHQASPEIPARSTSTNVRHFRAFTATVEADLTCTGANASRDTQERIATRK